ncbi:MAG: biotin/lipoyl-containing protein [Terriglobia bacterium]
MKFEVKIASASQTTSHVLELLTVLPASTNHGTLRFRFDGKDGEVDWAEVERGVYSLIHEGRSREVRVSPAPDPVGRGGCYEMSAGWDTFRASLEDVRSRRRTASVAALGGPGEVLAPMPGRVVKILIAENSDVKAGEGLLVIEAMKMHNEVRSPRPGRVSKIHVRQGEGVESGARLVLLT